MPLRRRRPHEPSALVRRDRPTASDAAPAREVVRPAVAHAPAAAPDRSRVGRIVARIAERQAGMVERGQLVEAGLTVSEVEGLLRRRFLHPRHRRVYAAGHQAPSTLGRLWAAVLAAGPKAVVCEAWAAWLHGLIPEPSGDVTLTVARDQAGVRSVDGYEVRRPRTLPKADVMLRDGLWITTVERTVLDLAATGLPTDRLVRVINEAFRRGRLTQAAIQRVVDEHPHHPGRRRLAALADDRLAPTRSAAEDELFAALRAAGLDDFEVNRRTTGPERDAYFRDAKLNIEVDGVAFHSGRDVIEADHERDRRSRQRGILTLRFTPRQVRERPLAVVAEIAAEHAKRTRGIRAT